MDHVYNICPDDYIIEDSPRGGYYCKQVGTNTDLDSIIDKIAQHMEQEQFWPSIWFVSDHGNVLPVNYFFKNGRIIDYTL